jgi:hypothetical protein
MAKSRSTKEYIDGCRSFMDFAIRNCKTPNVLIVCPCKTCRFNRRHSSSLVLNHLTRGKECGLNTKTRFITVRGLYELPLKALIQIVRS